jgi:energy-coupling factor transporter ATP-binding protein EcfA2
MSKMMSGIKKNIRITSVEFRDFKAFPHFSISLDEVNILVGPNNCGKSTVLGAFKALWFGLRKAKAKAPDVVKGPDGQNFGYILSDENFPISIENIHTDYAQIDSQVIFRLSNSNKLKLFFSKEGGVILFTDTEMGDIKKPALFNQLFPISLAIVPTLGPVENKEPLLKSETVQRELYTHRASRHFRNYWHYNPEGFEEFSELVRLTWPGMEIQKPEKPDYNENTISMFCLENRMTRELYWAGFGFQVWCQLLTHISRSRDSSIIVIDEPEIYLHPDVQRQLLSILRKIGPDILLATHSSEIITEADPSEILLIDKTAKSARRLTDISEVQVALNTIGSVQNISLTQLAKNRKVVFFEDNYDFQIIRWFAKIIGFENFASSNEITIIKSGGFSHWERINLVAGEIEKILGSPIKIAAVFDTDYHCTDEIDEIIGKLRTNLFFVHFHKRKEIENYLLIPPVLIRTIEKEIEKRCYKTGEPIPKIDTQEFFSIFNEVTEAQRDNTFAQYSAKKSDYSKKKGIDLATSIAETSKVFGGKWGILDERMTIVPGKKVLGKIREEIHSRYKVTITDSKIIKSFHREDVPEDLLELINNLDNLMKI